MEGVRDEVPDGSRFFPGGDRGQPFVARSSGSAKRQELITRSSLGFWAGRGRSSRLGLTAGASCPWRANKLSGVSGIRRSTYSLS